jgi:hypothetical protein
MNFDPRSEVCREHPLIATLNMNPILPLARGTALLRCFAASQFTPRNRKILVVTVTKGFRHSSIPTAIKVIADLGEKSKVYTVDVAFTDAVWPRR